MIGNIIFIAAMLLIVARFLTVWTGTPFPIDIVTSESMDPSLMEGDVVAWTPTNIEDIKTRDIVVFRSYIKWPGERIVVHRVSDIKTNSKGEILLETKGDANDWTDQAGPHQIEPYIREDHLMGKTVSIGQHPLKIPFIGYIALWLNDGIDLLSQPSNSKDASDSAGIFSPLIISIIILVVLIFIIPDKLKTFREKIRFNIFGSKPLSVKKTFMFFLTAYILFLLIIHCFAFDSLSASVGIESDSDSQSRLNFGRIRKGTESFDKTMPVFNPSIMSLKGVVFPRGQISQPVSRAVFNLESGGETTVSLHALASNNSKNGTYTGEMMVYSSPFWTIFPDELLLDVFNWNSEAAIYIFDFLAAVVLTTLTVLLMVIITFIIDNYILISINLSWHHIYMVIFKREKTQKIHILKKNVKQKFRKNIGWIATHNITDTFDEKSKILLKPVFVSLVIIPILFLLEDKITAMIISTLIAGFIAYLISCKIRTKIVLTTIFVMSLSVSFMIIHTNMMIITREYTFLEQLTLGIGSLGVYLLILGLLMIPLSLSSWAIACVIRNVKERRNPLLMLEGNCDL